MHIPANTTATIAVPTKDAAVTEGGTGAGKSKAVTFLRSEPGKAFFGVGSGTYSFGSGL